MQTYKYVEENQRENILRNAKILFLNEGYQKTTIAMIAEKSEVSVGLVIYYFKKKEILGQIFHNYILNIHNFINEQLGFFIENHFQTHLLFNRIFFMKIFENPDAVNLYTLLHEKNAILDSTHEYIRNSLAAIISEFNLDMSTEMFRKLAIAEFGARMALSKDMYTNPSQIKSNDYIDFLSTITVRLAGIDVAIIDKNIEKINEFMNYINLDNIRFDERSPKK